MEPLRFLHIPKTAGSTFTLILYRQYSGKKRFAFTGNLPADKTRFEALPDEERESIVLFTGHAPLLTGIDRVDRATTITLLRNPISRVKSYCQFIWEGKIPSPIGNSPFNLDELLASANPELSNLQTRLLVKDGRSKSFQSMSAAAARDEALNNLFNRITLYGIQEYFDESLMLFCSSLGWRLPLYVARNRKNTRNLLPFTEKQIERIMEMNAIDMQVYQAAKEKFLSVLHTAAFDETKLKRFQRINRPVSLIIRAYDYWTTHHSWPPLHRPASFIIRAYDYWTSHHSWPL